MYAEQLPAFIGNASVRLAMDLPEVLEGAVRLPAMLRFCGRYRVKGIGALFVSGLPDGLYRELSNSGHAFAHYLSVRTDADKATSRSAPFFDAIAANDLACASEIARASRATWNPELEYEDDFLYVYWLMTRFFLDGTPAACATLLERYAEVAGDGGGARLDVCRALQADDPLAFGDALSRLLESSALRYDALLAAESILPDVAATEANLNVEGLALVRLAELAGVGTEENYPGIPSLARLSPPTSFDPAAWQRSL